MIDPIRVLIVDDHPVVRDGLRGVLDGEPDLQVVGEASHGAEAVARARATPVDGVLMDLRMPVMGGVEAIGELRRTAPDVRVLVLTTYDTDRDVLPAIEAGATGYLLKGSSRTELIDAIRSAARGETVLSPSVAGKLFRERAQRTQTLSEREREILRLVARGQSNSEIGKTLLIGEATVKTYLLRAYRKLEVSDRTAAVIAAMERGIL
jgi:DNA-binding NarL/FixJ family response regulator